MEITDLFSTYLIVATWQDCKLCFVYDDNHMAHYVHDLHYNLMQDYGIRIPCQYHFIMYNDMSY